jgi:protein transport protein SEC13
VLELVGAGQAGTAASPSPFVQIAHFPAHQLGANSVSWAPSLAAGALTSTGATQTTPLRRFVTGGSDCAVKVWELSTGAPGSPVEAVLLHTLSGHADWVRDVAWSSTVLRKSYIASASQDRTVRVWTKEGDGEWQAVSLQEFGDVAWRVSWSLSGNILAVSTGDNKVSLWKERLSGGWDNVKKIEE